MKDISRTGLFSSLACTTAAAVLATLLLPPSLHAQDPDEPKIASKQVHTLAPGSVEFNESLLKRLQLPDGFSVNVFAKDLVNPRMMAVHEDGTVYVTIRDQNKVVALRDTNGDGKADKNDTIATGLHMVHGVAVRENKLYLCQPTKLLVADIGKDGKIGEPQEIFTNLPDGGQHPNRTIAFGPDGHLFISVGSTCNACEESNEENATMLKADLQKKTRTIFAKGLRNTVGFAFHPETKELWGMDHGTDMRGDDIPPEELNLIEEGKHYGWPFIYGKREVDKMFPSEPPGISIEEFAKKTTPMVLGYQAHSAPMAMVFYTGNQFPKEYRNDAFVALRGSWNRSKAVGYKVIRIHFENGKPTKISDFMTGFLLDDGKRHFGRISGTAVAKDGSLLVSDDSNGIIYRISHNSGGKKTASVEQ